MILKQCMAVIVLLATMSGIAAVWANEVSIYSSRQVELIKPALDKFTEATGVKTNLITGNADNLLKRLLIEGEQSPADILLTSDVGRLSRAKSAGLFQPVVSANLKSRVPDYLKDIDLSWYGLSLRARPIFYAKGVVDPNSLKDYSDLADSQWLGKICMRSSSNVYNQSLVASILRQKGVQITQDWLKNLVANFARDPKGGDVDQIRAIAAGECQITVANTYYYGQLLNSKNPADIAITEKVGLLWPNQKNHGVHVNVSGAGVLKTAKNKANAIRLLEFLTSNDIQRWYALMNNEFPVVKGIQPSKLLNSWGVFKTDKVTLSLLGDLNVKAVKLMNKAGWN